MLSSFGLGEMPAHHVVALVHVRRCRASNSEGPAGLKRALSAFCRLCVSHVVSGNAHFRTPSMSHTCPRSSDPAQDLDVCGGSSSRAPRSCIPLNMCMSIYVCKRIYMYIYTYSHQGFLLGRCFAWEILLRRSSRGHLVLFCFCITPSHTCNLAS